jgi:apolipoprotein N-acyltransferase
MGRFLERTRLCVGGRVFVDVVVFAVLLVLSLSDLGSFSLALFFPSSLSTLLEAFQPRVRSPRDTLC